MAAGLLAAMVTAAATLIFEYRRLNASLLRDAERQSGLFATIVALAGRDPGALSVSLQNRMLAEAMEHTSFLRVELHSTDQRSLFVKEREDGAARAEKFSGAGPVLPFSGSPAGSVHFSDKRLYQQVLIPLRDAHNGRVIGYLNGLYRLSMEDTWSVIGRLMLTGGLVGTAILLCCLFFYPGMVLLQHHLISSTGELNRTNVFLLRALGSALTTCGASAGGHHHRLVIYGVRLAQQLKLPATRIRGLIQAAFLHDLDRCGIPADLVRKTENLERQERLLLLAKHRQTSKQLKRQRWLREAEPILRCLHEHYDGSGFPTGLKGEKIPVGARIMGIVDRFDTLTIPGPQWDPSDLETALRTIEQESGSRFDPLLVSSFVAIVPRLYASLVGLDENQLGRELDTVVGRYLPS